MELILPVISGGLNIQDLEHKIADNQSPDMMNMWFKDRTLSKRYGQKYVSFTDGADPVTLGTVYGVSKEFEGYVCIHAGTKLYKWNKSTNVLTDLSVTVAAAIGVFMEFNGYLYHIDGTEIRQISSSWVASAVTPYIPLVYQNCTPTLTSSEAAEAYNLIGAGFKVTYNGDGTATYNLPLTGLDATQIIVKVGGVTKTLTTHYTWVAATGVVTFTAGNLPTTGTNNVEITAYKTVTGAKAKIAGCKIAIPFGGEASDLEGGSRAFLMGNPSYPRTYWYSDLGADQSNGMTYFPDTQYEELNQNNDAITAAGKQNGKLIIFKTKSLFSVEYTQDGFKVYYPVREFESSIGCDIPKSVQLIDNNLVFANTYSGVFMIINTAGTQEENTRPLSTNINGGRTPGLLQETNLSAATSIDFDRKYWLCVNGNVYMWDYDLSPYSLKRDSLASQKNLSWFKFNNINATYWHGSTELYYAYGTKIIQFIPTFSDFGKGISAWWKSKAFNFGKSDYEKIIQYVIPSIRADTNSSMTVTVSNETKQAFYSKSIDIESFSWRTFNWATFNWGVQRYSKPYRLKPRMKKVVYCQIWITGNDNYRDMGITDLTIHYTITRMVKR